MIIGSIFLMGFLLFGSSEASNCYRFGDCIDDAATSQEYFINILDYYHDKGYLVINNFLSVIEDRLNITYIPPAEPEQQKIPHCYSNEQEKEDFVFMRKVNRTHELTQRISTIKQNEKHAILDIIARLNIIAQETSSRCN